MREREREEERQTVKEVDTHTNSKGIFRGGMQLAGLCADFPRETSKLEADALFFAFL